MGSERASAEAAQNRHADRMIGYITGGPVGAMAAAVWVVVLNIFVLNYFEEQVHGPLQPGPRPTFWEHISYYSPLEGRFWRAVGGAVPETAYAGFCFAAILGVVTGCFDPLLKKRSAAKCCAMLWGFVFALPLLVSMFTGRESPEGAAMQAPVYIAAGLIFGGAMGLAANASERWFGSLVSRQSTAASPVTVTADKSPDPQPPPPSTPP